MRAPEAGTPSSTVSVLLVEDEPDMATLLDRTLSQSPVVDARVVRASTLAETLDRIASDESLDAILLDLGLPDAEGVGVVRRVVDALGDDRAATAVVVVTGLSDESVALSSLELGVQDYIVKDDLVPDLVVRVLRYSIARSRMQAELADARRAAERERELRRLERLSAERATTSVSSRMMGERSVDERMREGYGEVTAEYRRLLLQTLEERAFRDEGTVQEDLRGLATVLGFAGAGPRDVVRLHTAVLRDLVKELDPVRAEALLEEGRLVALELMGRLVVYYRARAVPAGSPDAGSA